MNLAPPNSVRIDLGNLLQRASTPEHFELLDLLLTAHRNAAQDNANISKQLCVAASYGSGKFRQGLIAAIASIGDTHAPLTAAREVFENAEFDQVQQQAANGAIIPGFGNSFFKTHIDPAFKPVHLHLGKHFTREENRLAKLTESVWKGIKAKERGTDKDTQLWPNAAMYTAIAAQLLGVPHGLEEVLFLLPRIPVWAEACLAPGL